MVAAQLETAHRAFYILEDSCFIDIYIPLRREIFRRRTGQKAGFRFGIPIVNIISSDSMLFTYIVSESAKPSPEHFVFASDFAKEMVVGQGRGASLAQIPAAYDSVIIIRVTA